MRSRTEMVTTTFVDSEEDYSDDDDSEEDWRPSASNKNGKKQKQQKASVGGTTKRGRKRKGSSVAGLKKLRRKLAYEESNEDEEDGPSEDDYDHDDFEIASGPSTKKPTILPPKCQASDKNSSSSGNDNEAEDILNLLVYVKDLTSVDPNKNNRLCLWRKDTNNLLQKYIRVKTAPDQFLFTSSSVYSSFDDKRICDFYDIKVKSIDSSNRRVKILNPSELYKIAQTASKNKKNNNDDDGDDDDDDTLRDEQTSLEVEKSKFLKSKDPLKKSKPLPKHIEQEVDDEKDVEENDEEEDDCDLEDDDDDVEEYDDEGEHE